MLNVLFLKKMRLTLVFLEKWVNQPSPRVGEHVGSPLRQTTQTNETQPR